MRISVRISVFERIVFPGPVKKSSSLTDLFALGPDIFAIAPSAINGGAISADGDELQRFPPTVARFRTGSEPNWCAASATIGNALRTMAEVSTEPIVASAPMLSPPRVLGPILSRPDIRLIFTM